MNPALAVQLFVTDDQRWQAVQSRDPTADGQFFYSVKTTGVYCRPSCSSRLPRPENLAFHASCIDAERAGFRPCKRCKPNEAGEDERHARIIAAACRQIEVAGQLLDLKTLAAGAQMSPFHFHRTFKRITGLTPRAYALALRQTRIQSRLQTEDSVTAALYSAGYNASSRFYEQADETLGMQPKRYRNGGAGEHIRYVVRHCSLGMLLVAATERGLCCIQLGDDAVALVKALTERFEKADLVAGDTRLEQMMTQVMGLIETPQQAASTALPLDVRGTVFQHKVWRALQEIPPGQAVSYSEMARRIGQPKAARAVAQACASNPVAVVIPCHRVVRNDGGLGGYRWGVERKMALLKREGKG